jgi:hypothetical protein
MKFIREVPHLLNIISMRPIAFKRVLLNISPTTG